MPNLPALFAAVPVSGEPGEGSYMMLIVYAFVAIGFSFLCSIAEAVLLSVTPSYIVTLSERRPSSAALLKRLKANIDRPLAAILSLNTIAHTVGAAGVGAEAAGIWGSRAVGLASAAMTLLILILSEIIPKTIGATFWRGLAPSIAVITQWLIYLLYPLVWLSEILTRLIAGGKKPHVVTREEVAAMADLGAKGGAIATGESKILQNLFRLDALKVRDVMTPRTVIVAFPEETTVDEVLQQRPNLPVSRIPIYQSDIDHVTGFVLKSDILLAQANDQHDTPLSELRREVTAVSEHASLIQLMDELLDAKVHFALVVDDYGGTDGVVTLEDLIETLLGSEIVDEADPVADMRRLARRKWEKRADALGLNVEAMPVATESTPPATESPAPPAATE